MLITITGAGGFIGGALTGYFLDRGVGVRAVDKKPIPEWHQAYPTAENLCLDVSLEDNCKRVCAGADEVYNLAADMGGMGFIENNRIACLRSILINTHMLEAAWRAGVGRYFYASSACVYNTDLQQQAVVALKESDAYPAMSERGYGWEKLLSEMFCQEYCAEHHFETHIARFHNVYGPFGTWRGGREKAPAAICRKVAEAVISGNHRIDIWGDGAQTRSFMWIGDCVEGIDKIMHCDDLIATPINLGSSELISVNDLVSMIEGFEEVTLERHYDLNAPKGVVGRSSDNTMIKSILSWEPTTPLVEGLNTTYQWIKSQVR